MNRKGTHMTTDHDPGSIFRLSQNIQSRITGLSGCHILSCS